MNWKFYVRKDGDCFDGGLVFIIRDCAKNLADYIYPNGRGYYGSLTGFAAQRFITLYKEISLDDALNMLEDCNAKEYFCMKFKLVSSDIQGPPNLNNVERIKKTLISKRAFCSDSALKFEFDDLVTINYLIAQKEIFSCKKEFNKYYIPEPPNEI